MWLKGAALALLGVAWDPAGAAGTTGNLDETSLVTSFSNEIIKVLHPPSPAGPVMCSETMETSGSTREMEMLLGRLMFESGKERVHDCNFPQKANNIQPRTGGLLLRPGGGDASRGGQGGDAGDSQGGRDAAGGRGGGGRPLVPQSFK